MFTRHIAKAIGAETKRIADIARYHGAEAARSEADRILIIDGLAQNIRRLYVFVALKAARRITKEVNTSVKRVEVKVGGDPAEVWTQQIIEFFKLYLLSKAVIPVSATVRAYLLTVIERGLLEGWGIDKMAVELESPEFSLVRARLIARTEIVKAQFYGEQLGIDNSEFETVEMWVSAHDHRVRSSHRKVDGDTIDTGGKFKVDRIRNNVIIGYDMMKGPGDPEASVENVANCRCVRTVRAKRDEKGRIIRKRKNLVVS